MLQVLVLRTPVNLLFLDLFGLSKRAFRNSCLCFFQASEGNARDDSFCCRVPLAQRRPHRLEPQRGSCLDDVVKWCIQAAGAPAAVARVLTPAS